MAKEIEDFIEVISSEFDIEYTKIRSSSPFRKLKGWDSMRALLVIARIEEVYGIVLNEEDLQHSETIADLYEAVKMHQT